MLLLLLLLARHVLERLCADPTPPSRPALQAVHSLFVQAKTSSLPASREKYAHSKFSAVSQLGTAESLPEYLFAWQ